MRVLLDTHTLLWSVLSPEVLSPTARAIITDLEAEIVVSAASAWEIATKVRLGRLPDAEEFERHFMQDMAGAGYHLRPITVEDGLRAGRFTAPRQDPFDRMIAAQALAEDIPILSLDAKLDAFGVRRIW